ncbi:ATP-grasp domain-containing protein [Polynucleobacter brandtiae]|uniref:ATP-grasp domain-containing protein n=1 Tax=Polynucleobacter brandtiae TaxID=1938816 RepID=A0A2M8VH97_9BURK|nr:ATP-grasp domain-containing protein [Polynucleobacter brandtiae]PJI76064.1 ATP-grasp domain-containing protein [Polynucleobacter brandtiae]
MDGETKGLKKILILFAKDWDHIAVQAQKDSNRYQFYFEGFDLFQFPDNIRLLSFDVVQYIKKLGRKYRQIGLDGIISNHEQFGTLIAALLAQRLGLPGNDPLAIIACQHKLYSRLLQQKIVPEAVPRFAYISYPVDIKTPIEIPFPFFIKPIKATYSVLCKKVRNFSELRQHLRFNYFEELLIRKLVQPFAELMLLLSPMRIDPNGLIAEEILEGEQINIDGYCQGGLVYFLGVIDEIMYPDTQAFMRFEYPSVAPQQIQNHAMEITTKLLQSINYCHGFFNIEFFYQPLTNELKIIEINPRAASQLMNLYEHVDGYKPYDILFALAVGEKVAIKKGEAHFKSAASFIFRHFKKPQDQKKPHNTEIKQVLKTYPDADIMFYYKKGASLQRELKWLGSYRYAVLNLGGISRLDLFNRFQSICQKLNIPPSMH